MDESAASAAGTPAFALAQSLPKLPILAAPAGHRNKLTAYSSPAFSSQNRFSLLESPQHRAYTTRMASAIQIPVSEYLQTSYRPDREYVDGELRERNVGKWEHSRLQWLLALWFGNHEAEWDVIGSTEQRVQVSPERVRIPDVVVLRPGTQQEVLTDPPLLVIEILSPDDTYSDLEERCQDYRAMGVQTIWIIDPKTRTGRISSGPNWQAAERLELPGSPIHVHLPTLFAQIATQAIQTSPGTPDPA
jgi:Uma2 family endonuclease